MNTSKNRAMRLSPVLARALEIMATAAHVEPQALCETACKLYPYLEPKQAIEVSLLQYFQQVACEALEREGIPLGFLTTPLAFHGGKLTVARIDEMLRQDGITVPELVRRAQTKHPDLSASDAVTLLIDARYPRRLRSPSKVDPDGDNKLTQPENKLPFLAANAGFRRPPERDRDTSRRPDILRLVGGYESDPNPKS